VRSQAARRERAWRGTLAALARGVEHGTHIFRVHDVAAAADFLAVRAALPRETDVGRDLELSEEIRYERLGRE
jgi:dihydropteroate synthase